MKAHRPSGGGHPAGAVSSVRLWVGSGLLLVYAVPLLVPPPAVCPIMAAHASFLERMFPGVPPWWVVLRLVALGVGAVLLSGGATSASWRGLEPRPGPGQGSGRHLLRYIAAGCALAHVAMVPWADTLGMGAQNAYLAMLFVPAGLLTVAEWAARRSRRPSRPPNAWRLATAAAPTGAVILFWTVCRLLFDVNSPRAVDVVDSWRAFMAMIPYVSGTRNLLTTPLDPDAPGLGAPLLVIHGLPLFQAGLVPFGLRWIQISQIAWLALMAPGVAVMARVFIGRGVSALAVAVFLFAPFTRTMLLTTGPLLVGPVYGTAIVLCGAIACLRRSEAALAALGAVCGIAITYAGVMPTVGLVAGLTVWHLRSTWRSLWVGWVAGFAAFAAAVVPAIPEVLRPDRAIAIHLSHQGPYTLMEAPLLGQLPVATTELALSVGKRALLDVFAGSWFAPFANGRTALRLWGDVLFDPLGAAFLAVGLIVCLRSAKRSAVARFFLLLGAASLCPAFYSSFDRVNMAHAVVLPVPVAFLSAVGFVTVRRYIGGARARRIATALAVAAICGGGAWVFDGVNPRILAASSAGIMLRALPAEEASRAVALAYPSHTKHAKWLFTGAIATYAGKQPIGYFEYEGAGFPADALAEEGKDLLFWSPGLDLDFQVGDAVCRQWPDAALYAIWDETLLSRVYAASIGGQDWEPRRWRTHSVRATCGAPPTWRDPPEGGPPCYAVPDPIRLLAPGLDVRTFPPS